MTDTLSILTHRTLPLAKIWHADGTISDYSKPKHFTVEQIVVDGIINLSALLYTLEKNSYSCLIRGKYTGTEPKNTLRRKEIFSDQPLHTFMAEIDNFVPALFDPLLSPVESIEEYIAEVLPDCFHTASYHWQLSNSFGSAKNIGILKAHVWFYLKTPYTSAQMRAWAKHEKIELDVSTLDPVQIHYTSGPIFENIESPIHLRSGFVSKSNNAVPFIIDPASEASEAIERPTGGTYQGDDVVAQWLEENGLAKGVGENGKIFIDCPFAENHTDHKIGESDTTYLPSRPGFPNSVFHCSHASCADIASSDFERALGCEVAYFDALKEEPAPVPKGERFTLISYDTFANREPPGYIIQDVLPKAEMGIIFGASTAGKSFVALDMAFAIARGTEWNGCEAKTGRVIYIAAEGAAAFSKRLRAYMMHNSLSGPLPFQIMADAPNFFLKDDAVAVAKSILSGGSADVIFTDTLAQTSIGANENSAEDIGKILSNIKELHRATGALMMLVHHEGKDETKGARGSTSLKAGADVEICVSRKGEDRKITITKQKDGEDGKEWRFKLIPLEIDPLNSDETSCVLSYEPAKAKRIVRVKKRGYWQNLILGALDVLSSPALQAGVIDYCLKTGIERDTETDKKGKLKPDRRREEIRSAMKVLATEGDIELRDGLVSLEKL